MQQTSGSLGYEAHTVLHFQEPCAGINPTLSQDGAVLPYTISLSRLISQGASFSISWLCKFSFLEAKHQKVNLCCSVREIDTTHVQPTRINLSPPISVREFDTTHLYPALSFELRAQTWYKYGKIVYLEPS
jgi:hypothetical protein